MDWFRSWHGAPTDTAFLVIARRAQVAPGMVSAVYWALLDYASQNNPRGSIAGFDSEAYAEWAGWEEAQVIAIIAAFHGKGKITEDGEIVAWADRQPKREDDSAPRVKAFRDRQKALQDDVTHGNAVKQNVTTDKNQIREDQKDEGLARPPASKSTSAFPEQDPEWGAAISKLEAIGPMTGNILLELLALWPDLTNGKRAWLDDAITLAQANGAGSPAYAVRVLTNSVRSGKRPGEVTSHAHRRRSGGITSRDLDEILGVDIHGNPVNH